MKLKSAEYLFLWVGGIITNTALLVLISYICPPILQEARGLNQIVIGCNFGRLWRSLFQLLLVSLNSMMLFDLWPWHFIPCLHFHVLFLWASFVSDDTQLLSLTVWISLSLSYQVFLEHLLSIDTYVSSIWETYNHYIFKHPIFSVFPPHLSSLLFLDF